MSTPIGTPAQSKKIDMRNKFTIEDLIKCQEIMEKSPRPERQPLYFTKEMIQLFIDQGQAVDLVKKTINNMPFEYLESFTT